MTACGGGTQSSAPPAVATHTVAAGSGCAADHRQDLTFSGALTGHLVCAEDQPVCAFIAITASDQNFIASIHAIADGKPMQISFEVNYLKGAGTYRSDNIEGGTSITVDATLDVPAHWQGHVGDPITVTLVDQHVLTGSLVSTLTGYARGDVHLSGTWVCDVVKG